VKLKPGAVRTQGALSNNSGRPRLDSYDSWQPGCQRWVPWGDPDPPAHLWPSGAEARIHSGRPQARQVRLLTT